MYFGRGGLFDCEVEDYDWLVALKGGAIRKNLIFLFLGLLGQVRAYAIGARIVTRRSAKSSERINVYVVD